MDKNVLQWIKIGYTIFSQKGPNGIKVQTISKLMGKSKSSFYHFFSDKEIYIEALLNYHLERASIIIEKERQCKNVNPEMLHVLLEFKEDLLFSRQLRIHREVSIYKDCFEKINEMSAEVIIGIWSEMLDLKDNSASAMLVLNLSLENFYLQITEKTLTFEWLDTYTKELKAMVKSIQNGYKP